MDKDEKMEKVWQHFQELMHYNSEQLVVFKSRPKFVKMMNTPAFRTHKIIGEVIYSHGCVCQHNTGQKIVLNGNGAFISAECPPIMCAGLVAQFNPVVWAIFERFVEGLDPNGICADTFGCMDVGLKCGGWGRVVVKVHVEESQH